MSRRPKKQTPETRPPQASETWYQAIFEQAADGIFISDTQCRYLEVNPRGCQMLGYSHEEMLNFSRQDLLPAEDLTNNPPHPANLLAGKIILRERYLRCKDGRLLPVEIKAQRLADGNLLEIMRDITERKQAMEALRLTRFVIQNISHGVYWIDSNARILDVNEAACRTLGYTREELTQMSLVDIDPGFSLNSFPKAWQIQKQKGSLTLEVQHKTKDGRLLPMEVVINFIQFNGQELTCCLAQDITERKRTEEALQESETRFRNIVETTQEWIWEIDRDGRMTYNNPAIEKILGYTPDELLGNNTLDYMYAEDRQQIEKRLPEFVAQKRGWSRWVVRWLHKDGTTRWLESNAAPILEVGGRLVGFRGTDRDITERKQTEEALRKSEARYRALIESQIDVISRYLPDTTLTFVNDAYCQFYGKTRGELIGHSYLSMVAPEFRERTLKNIGRMVKIPAPITNESLNYRWDGTECWIQWVIQGITDENGRVVELQAIGRDITLLKQSEQILRQSEEDYRNLYENAPNGYLSVNKEGLVGRCNRYLVEMLGYNSADEIVGKPVEDLYADTPHGKSKVLQIFQNIRAGGTVRDEELQMQKRDGTPVWVSLTANAESDDKGQFRWIRSMVVNITERKQAVEALRQSEERFAKAFRASPFGLVITRLSDGKIIEVNHSWQNIFGYSPEELAEQTSITLNIFKNPADREHAVAQIQQQGFIRDLELEINRKSGEMRLISVSAEMIEINNEPCSITILNDITERKQVERALQLQSERLKLLSEIDRAILTAKSSAEIADVVLARVRQLIPSYRASIILFDYERQEVLGFAVDFDGDTNLPVGKLYPLDQETLDLFPADEAAAIADIRILANPSPAIRQLAAEGIVSMLGAPLLMHGELKGRLNLSSDRPHAFTSEHLEIAGQVAIQLAIALQQNQLYEQTRLQAVELEQRVAERTAQLETANKELEAFAYSVSHDLRAPLRAIDGYTRILLEDYEPSLDAEGKRVCAIVCDEARRMGHLIDDLLTFSRFSRADLQICPINMKTLVHSVFYELTTPEERERLDFHIDSLPPAMGDPTSIRQVWLNLLANAIKFSSKKERATIQVLGKQDRLENIYSVQDNGAGFDKQYIDKLFGVFQRLHNEEEFEGSGVGLAIVQRVIYRHGGRVWADSELDQGATFYFALPRNGG